MIGWEYLLAFDFDITFSQMLTVESVASDYNYIRLPDMKIKFIGIVGISERKRGFVKFAEMTFSSQTSKQLSFQCTINHVVDQSLNQIKVIPGCPQNISFDIHKDCLFDILDVARLKYYQTINGDTVVDSKNYAMDTDQNGVIDLQDTINIYDIYLGRIEAISELQVKQPSQASDCQFLISVVVKYLGLGSLKQLDSKMFALFTSSNSIVHDQLLSSKVSLVSSYIFNVDSKIKYGDIIAMNQNLDGYFLSVPDWPVQAEDVGLSFILVPSTVSSTNRVMNTLKKSLGQTNQIKSIVLFPNSLAFEVESSFSPQLKITFEETSHRCKNPLVTTNLQMMFDYNYDLYVQPNKILFEHQFKTFYENYELANNHRVVTVTRVNATKGSIYIDMDILIEKLDQDSLVADLLADLVKGKLMYCFIFFNHLCIILLTLEIKREKEEH